MRINTIETEFKDELFCVLREYMHNDDCLVKFYEYLITMFIERLLWDKDNIRRYNDWFFLNVNRTMEETRQDDQEIINYIEQLKDLSLIKVRDNNWSGTILMKIDLDMIKAVYKINHEKSREDDYEEDYM